MNQQGLRIVHRSVVQQAAGSADAVLRDGTTGQAVLPRVWAVGGPVAVEVAPYVERMQPESAGNVQPELAFYRKYTEAMLRRYLRLSMSTGRVPSLLGRELFRSKVTSYRVQSFDDVVIFCIDVERCLARLEHEEVQLVRRIALQEYTQGEAAGLLGLSLRDVVRKYAAAIDRLTGILLASGMLEPLKAMAGATEH